MHFLKCDADGCDHVEETEGLHASQIGRPCPKCGASLLTKEDYDAAVPLFAMMNVLVKAGLARLETSEPKEGEAILSIHHHAGKTKIEMEGK